MGGAACAKAVIDNMNGLNRATACMATSILLASSKGIEPSYEELEEWLKAAESVARVAAAIERRMSSEAGLALGKSDKAGHDGGAHPA